jgi:hypothetical protein
MKRKPSVTFKPESTTTTIDVSLRVNGEFFNGSSGSYIYPLRPGCKHPTNLVEAKRLAGDFARIDFASVLETKKTTVVRRKDLI